MERSWRLVETEFPDDPPLNLALEEALLLEANGDQEKETLRLWRNLNCIVLGRREDVAREVNLDAAAKHGTRIIRRFTAGGTVYQDLGNLNWTLVFHRDKGVFARWSCLREMFEVVSKPLVEALREIGADAKFQAPNSISVQGKKISGMAAYLKSKAALCHGTLLVTTDLVRLEALLRNLKHDVTTLEREIGRVDIREVEGAVKRSYQRSANGLKKGNPSEEELKLATVLKRNKYAAARWNRLGVISEQSIDRSNGKTVTTRP